MGKMGNNRVGRWAVGKRGMGRKMGSWAGGQKVGWIGGQKGQRVGKWSRGAGGGGQMGNTTTPSLPSLIRHTM